MLVVFCSNFMNHHQYFLSQEFINSGVEYYFVAMGKLPKEQQALGYYTYDEKFIVQYNEDNEEYINKLILLADAVIFGSKPEHLYKLRVNSGKLTFNFSERLFKKSKLREVFAFTRVALKKKYLLKEHNVPYVLCAGSYVAMDYRRLGYPKDKFLKWGYFPDIPNESFEDIKSKKVENSLIWVGRFIPWKHPEYVLELAQYLKKKRKKFTIKMVGIGELYNDIKKKITKRELDDVIQLTGAVSPERVLELFQESEIALLTSDRNEGWGAVVNESLASACATVACKQMGSVSYLIEQNKNGLIYEFGKKKEFFKAVESVLDNSAEKNRLAKNAYQSIQDTWNYKVAAARLLTFIKDRVLYQDNGPISDGLSKHI